VPRHVARLVTRLFPPLIVDYSGLVVDYFASAACPGASARRVARHAALAPLIVDYSGLVVDYFAYAARLGASAHRAAHRSSSTTSPTPRVRVPRHVAWPVTGFVVDYSVRRNFLLRPQWLYFSHAVRRDYLSRGNTGSTSSMPRAATTSSSGHIASTIQLWLVNFNNNRRGSIADCRGFIISLPRQQQLSHLSK
jgi:hypothetical protein